MKNVFDNSNWIWYTDSPVSDSYGDFFDSISYTAGNVNIHISCDGDYSLYVNGKFVNSNQYGDFEHYKIYDTIDITDFLIEGKNNIYILVWHLGIDSSRYKAATAGLIYTVECNGKELANSSYNTLSRENPNYKSNYNKVITGQLGQSFLYDATKTITTKLNNSFIVDKTCNMFPRPVKKLLFLKEKEIKIIENSGNHYIIDLEEETVGLPVLRFETTSPQKILVAWGEHIVDGKVRRKIGGRDFSFEYIAKAGYNSFNNYMLRLGCRYLEIFSEENISIDYIGVIPQVYPLNVIDKDIKNPLDKKIYDASVNTLKLCIMEHYVDTPWREQCLYAFDSRNQMLCGYNAFKDKNKDYARANLLLISKDNRDDNILSITYPSGGNLAIPSFSLYYFLSVNEYMNATNDYLLGCEVFDKLNSVINVFIKNIHNGLFKNFVGKDYWHFYDWSDYMTSPIGQKGADTDLMINCLLVLALENFKNISEKIGKDFIYQSIIDDLKFKIKEVFFSKESGLFSMLPGKEQYTELGNSVAVLANIPTEDESKFIAQKLATGELNECSLSMKCFKYDALLKVDKNYRVNVIDEIRNIYKPMLDIGCTTVWEVVEGQSAFDNAGSLCHGWSSIPVMYL